LSGGYAHSCRRSLDPPPLLAPLVRPTARPRGRFVYVGQPPLLVTVVDIPLLDLDPLHERASVVVEPPTSAVILDDVPGVHVGLATFTRLDLVGGGGDTIAALRVGEHPDIPDDLADLGKLDRARYGEMTIRVVQLSTLHE